MNNISKKIVISILFAIFFVLAYFVFFEGKRVEEMQSMSANRNLRINQILQIRHNIEKFKKQNKKISLLFVGDIMLSRSIEKKIKENNNASFPFLNVSEKIKAVDIAVGNLEGPISSRGNNQGSINSFRARPEVASALSIAGFDVLSLANNHIFDWGRDALLDTLNLLSSSTIYYVGAGKNYEDANDVKIIEKNGYRVGFLSYTNLYPKSLFASTAKPGISEYNEEKILTKIKEVKNKTDLLVVLLHWGDEYKTHSNSEQKRLAHLLVDSGVNFVIGTHPHVSEEVEQYKDGWIAYSLGNFVFDQAFSKETMNGLGFLVECKGESGCVGKSINVEISKDFQPTFVGF